MSGQLPQLNQYAEAAGPYLKQLWKRKMEDYGNAVHIRNGYSYKSTGRKLSDEQLAAIDYLEAMYYSHPENVDKAALMAILRIYHSIIGGR